jgi:hypothetical protein
MAQKSPNVYIWLFSVTEAFNINYNWYYYSYSSGHGLTKSVLYVPSTDYLYVGGNYASGILF